MATSDNSDTGNQESGSTAFFDHVCQPCKNDGKILEAEGRCEDCDEYLCKPCFISHTVPSITRHHVMIGKEQLDGTQQRKDQYIQKCSQHDDEIIKYYCPTHSFLGCSACMILNHKSCSGTIYIPDVAKDVLSSEEYRNYKASKSDIEATSHAITTDVKERINTFNECQVAAVEELRVFKKDIIDLFEAAEKKITEESENVKAEELKKQESILDETSVVEKELITLTTPVERFESLKQYCNLYIAIIKTQGGLKSCVRRLGDIDQRKYPHRKLCFLPNHSIVDTLSDRGVGKIIDGITQVAHEKDINVKTQSDNKPSWISSSVMLPDNKLIIADRSNDKLKVIDTRQDKVVDELSFSSHPWDVAAINSNEVAVTLPFKKKIAFVKTDGKLVKNRSLDVDGACRGLLCTENTLVVTFENPSKVVVMDTNCVFLRTFPNADRREAIMKEPYYVVSNYVNKAIYISDAKGGRVYCFSFDGRLKSTYTDKVLRLPTGMAVDSFDTFYVCDWANHNVHQITEDCKKKRILLTEKDVTKPYAITYSDTEGKFYIGMRDSDIMKVFKVM